jgi:serine/threonine protein kinase, bacterial
VRLSLPDRPALADIAANGAGDLHVGDGNRVVKLAAGSINQTAIPMEQDFQIGGIAVDAHGNVFVSEYTHNQIFVIHSNATQFMVEPLHRPGGLAVDRHGDLFVTDTASNRVLELPQRMAHRQ